MNNADLPAMPLSSQAYSDLQEFNCSPEGAGITKREFFSIQIMAQMSAIRGCTANDSSYYKSYAKHALWAADALLKQLEPDSKTSQQSVSHCAISWLYENHPDVYEGFYERV